MGQRPRQYIWDRVNGTSKYDEENRPPFRPCWAPPCVYYCSRLMEQNPLCEFLGSRGIIEHDNQRGRVNSFRVALLAAKLGTLFSILSCFAISRNFDILWIAPFTEGTVSIVNRTFNASAILQDHKFPVSEIRVGLTAVAVSDAIGDEGSITRSASTGEITSLRVIPEQVVTFEEFCTKINRGLEYYMNPAQCGECHEASNGLVASCIFGVLLELPGMFSDVLRMYPNYDVNCQKFFGTVMVGLSLLSSVYTARGYSMACFANFYDGNVGFDRAGNAARPGATDTVFLNFSWRIGNGLVFLYVSMAFKVVDIICNLLVQTPPITRDRKEQEEYERLYGGRDGKDAEGVEKPAEAAANDKIIVAPPSPVAQHPGNQEERRASC